LGEQDGRRLVDEQVDVLGHEDVGVDAGLMTGTGLFEDGLEGGLGFWGCEIVEGFCLLESVGGRTALGYRTLGLRLSGWLFWFLELSWAEICGLAPLIAIGPR